MNEPSVITFQRDSTLPDYVVHDWDSARQTHAGGGHNVYGMLMARATREGLQKQYPNKRPFVLTRAAYAGAQRYAATWTGRQCLNLGSPAPEYQHGAQQRAVGDGVHRGGCRRVRGRAGRRIVHALDAVGQHDAVFPRAHHDRHGPPGTLELWRAVRNNHPALPGTALPASAVHLFRVCAVRPGRHADRAPAVYGRSDRRKPARCGRRFYAGRFDPGRADSGARRDSARGVSAAGASGTNTTPAS